ncbi:MAG: ABC transporter substrate-binding protein [Deltaproteobacteria bacterium]|nr:ABC transporter substrate-binding protein [Deltaproteobacteria bacterium]
MRLLLSSLVLLGALAGLSCSAGVIKPATCATDGDCRSAFTPNHFCAEDGLCSLGSCSTDTECRDTLGLGWGCGDDSLCFQPAPPARCSSTPATILTAPDQHTDDLLIGSIFDQSDFSIMVKAARLAVLQVNDRDGLGGRPVGIIECTNEENADFDALTFEEATAAMGRILVERYGVPAIIGPATSGRSEVAFNALSPMGTLLISPSATSPALTNIDGLPPHSDGDPGLFWRTAPPDSLQGRVIAEQMVDVLGATSAAVIHETGAYGEGLSQVFQENFAGGGRTAQAFPFANSTDLATITATVGADTFDQVLVISSRTGDVSAFLNAAAGISGFANKGIFLTDGARDQQLLDETAGIAEALYPNIRGTVPAFRPGLVYDTFSAAYSIVFDGEDPAEFGFSAHAWDAGWLVLFGAAWADAQQGVINGTNIATGLRKVSAGDALDLGPTDWTTARATFAEGTSVDISGASGALDYDDASGETTAPIVVWGITGSEFVDVDCVDYSAADEQCEDLGDDDDATADDDDATADDDDATADDDDATLGDDDDSASR